MSTAPKQKRIPAAPRGLGVSGRKLWRAVLGDFDLEEHELALVRELCRIVDRLDVLDDVLARDGMVIDGQRGPKAHPALAEARQQAIAAARITAALRMPDGEELVGGTDGRRQRRGGVRGIYQIHGVG